MSTANQEIRFKFGDNWLSFVHTALNEHRISSAIDSLRLLLKTQDLHGQTFLDIGCGSGLSSLAALSLGAAQVISFDYDLKSVEASLFLRQKMNIPSEKWQIMKGSVLDVRFMETLELADVVYSWGVLHHTGQMWRAIDNAVTKVKPGGLLAIAIYNNVESKWGGSAMWWWIKRSYNRSPAIIRYLMEYTFLANLMLRYLLTLRNPWDLIQHYGEGSLRGMDFWHDVRDWLGGFPYEYATASDVFNYLSGKFGLQLLYLNTHSGHACNEFTFLRPGAN